MVVREAGEEAVVNFRTAFSACYYTASTIDRRNDAIQLNRSASGSIWKPMDRLLYFQRGFQLSWSRFMSGGKFIGSNLSAGTLGVLMAVTHAAYHGTIDSSLPAELSTSENGYSLAYLAQQEAAGIATLNPDAAVRTVLSVSGFGTEEIDLLLQPVTQSSPPAAVARQTLFRAMVTAMAYSMATCASPGVLLEIVASGSAFCCTPGTDVRRPFADLIGSMEQSIHTIIQQAMEQTEQANELVTFLQKVTTALQSQSCWQHAIDAFVRGVTAAYKLPNCPEKDSAKKDTHMYKWLLSEYATCFAHKGRSIQIGQFTYRGLRLCDVPLDLLLKMMSTGQYKVALTNDVPTRRAFSVIILDHANLACLWLPVAAVEWAARVLGLESVESAALPIMDAMYRSTSSRMTLRLSQGMDSIVQLPLDPNDVGGQTCIGRLLPSKCVASAAACLTLLMHVTVHRGPKARESLSIASELSSYHKFEDMAWIRQIAAPNVTVAGFVEAAYQVKRAELGAVQEAIKASFPTVTKALDVGNFARSEPPFEDRRLVKVTHEDVGGIPASDAYFPEETLEEQPEGARIVRGNAINAIEIPAVTADAFEDEAALLRTPEIDQLSFSPAQTIDVGVPTGKPLELRPPLVPITPQQTRRVREQIAEEDEILLATIPGISSGATTDEQRGKEEMASRSLSDEPPSGVTTAEQLSTPSWDHLPSSLLVTKTQTICKKIANAILGEENCATLVITDSLQPSAFADHATKLMETAARENRACVFLAMVFLPDSGNAGICQLCYRPKKALAICCPTEEHQDALVGEIRPPEDAEPNPVLLKDVLPDFDQTYGSLKDGDAKTKFLLAAQIQALVCWFDTLPNRLLIRGNHNISLGEYLSRAMDLYLSLPATDTGHATPMFKPTYLSTDLESRINWYATRVSERELYAQFVAERLSKPGSWFQKST